MIGSEEKVYQIGEVAKLLGITGRTIRYYEEIGLLNGIRRMDHGKRVYTDEHLRRLKFIKKLKLLGLSLSEMQDLERIYRVHGTNRRFLPELISLLEQHGRRVDERIRELTVLKKEIEEYRKRMEGKLEVEVSGDRRKRGRR